MVGVGHVDGAGDTASAVDSLVDLGEFSFKEVLGSDSAHKSAFVLLQSKSGERAILLADKNSFPVDKDSWREILTGSALKIIMKNDVYSSYTLYMPQNFSGVKSTLIYPCNDKHIAKYREQKRFVINETAEDYRTITLPYIEQNQMCLGWVYNILEHKAEADRIIYEDPDPHNGFIMAPDLKWSGEQIECLYVQALVRRKGIKSIRDLTANDLPLLEGIRDKGLNAIREKYGIDKHQICAYFHYQPSFYHLHVHFIHVSYDAPASGVAKFVWFGVVVWYIRMLLFCPECGSSLQIEEGQNCLQFSCHNCPYVQPITKLIKSRVYPKLKDLDEVLGGPGAWENAQITDGTLFPVFRSFSVLS
ncbi:m7GpppX diphosphatase [Toxocara canis]|uniref:m7GpppX diphosphatase n=1 Tax=Toxocara canis TaxID=6265 RepID=A0A0B2W1S2_TOXCA|nr:m7GpppX diphosphatase [Toxocara canis]